MKKITVITILLISITVNSQINARYVEIRNSWDSCFVEIENKTNKSLIFFLNLRSSEYKISSSKLQVVDDFYSPYSQITTSNYNDCMKIPESKIKYVQNKYNLSYNDAINFLFKINSIVVIPKNRKKIIGFKMFNYLEYEKNHFPTDEYFLSTKLRFKNSTFKFPKQYVDSLSKKYQIVDEIYLPLKKIDINSFYSKVNIDSILLNSTASTDENCNIIFKKRH
ncbi:hypothetical protein [Epilithonimonas hungarica]|uniref:Uncharacterized protein n=1 Tax=Epilithonimonas hungarica TaxID=454006 RepID=A0A1G7LMB9_9FLAO|nr:hypothetical protein [Epilithonimonas hungarica]SDF50658.1 hypothetical protein SAMN05421825_1545 [Epilithonimonas hungarica]